ncbi:Cobalamin biosynthesis protein CobT [Rickettsiales bacterium Ac37b]|nr:Cobalamin biosynthesis protein CobT [Rickettsiales bacterium Ac37b]
MLTNDLKQAINAASRAISGSKKLNVEVRERGEGDLQALILLYHNSDLSNDITSKENSIIIEKCEQARIEALGGRRFKGVLSNLNRLLIKTYTDIIYSSDNILYLLVRAKLIDTPVMHLISLEIYDDYNKIVNRYRDALVDALNNQQKFAQIIIKLIEELKLNVPDEVNTKKIMVELDESNEAEVKIDSTAISYNQASSVKELYKLSSKLEKTDEADVQKPKIILDVEAIVN